ncbi:uncharacterized protein LOC113324983 [Papaver somniferum]|uniref:uncharacterized protein LOC113324983 n=1 Tax=Papaver somniferum TaxID=3469 RepID=UPI000E6FD72C|nr:uncharacterized protein LOC113324983 [Papaver somniferum]
MVIHNSVSNKKGNIWLFWNRNLPTPTVVSISSQMITVDIGGVLISVEEKIGGKNPNRSAMMDFNNYLDTCELIQATQTGLMHSWSNFNMVAKGYYQKLKKLKKILREWNWNVFGNINVQVKEAEAKVQDVMINSDSNPFDEEALNTLVAAQNLYNSKEVQLNTFLKQKSRTKWIKDGAANTGFLYANLKIRQARNIIKVITKEYQEMIEEIPSTDEIKATIFAMDQDSAPVMINGGPCGFFSVGGGLRQGDPLSPFFLLMEEASNRRITQMVNEKLIYRMVERKGIHLTHLFFADDVFIFCNGAKKSTLNLMKLLEAYQKCSVQTINKQKSKIFIDGTSELRNNQIKDMIQMERSVFPDKYLGVILIVGRVKVSTIWPMVEMMQKKLATWKGDGDIRQYNKFSWKRVCTPLSEGGLAKYKDKNGQWSTKWKKSTVWPGLKWAWEALKGDIIWNVGDGAKISVWFDLWIGDCSLIGRFGNISYISENLNLKVSDILIDGKWSLDVDLQQLLQNLRMPEVLGGEDILLWTGNLKEEFSIPEAVNKLRHKEFSVSWSRYIWKPFIHPSVASNVWKLIQGVYMDDTIMVINGYDIVSRCCICETEQDSMHHVLWECRFSVEVWRWICNIFKFNLPNSFVEVWKSTSNKIPLVKKVWITAVCVILKELWFHKNKILFEVIKPNMNGFKCRILKLVHEGGLRITGTKWCQNYDQEIISRFHLGLRMSGFQCTNKCNWLPPEHGFIMLCCDGSSFVNHGSAGFGVVVRDSQCQVVGTLTGGI